MVNECLSKVTTPFLCIHAENDKICSLEGSRHLHNVATSCTDKSLIIFPEVNDFLLYEIKIEDKTAIWLITGVSYWH